MEYQHSFYRINPDNPILTNLLGFLGEYMMEGILGRFNPFDTAEMFFKELRFDPEEMLAFEDLTWDTVFANLKTLEFEASCSESDDPRMDMSYYMHFADMIHDLDADTLNRGLAPELQAMGGWISSEIVKIFMEAWKRRCRERISRNQPRNSSIVFPPWSGTSCCNTWAVNGRRSRQ